MKQRMQTFFLKIVFVFTGIAALALSLFALPKFAKKAAELVPEIAFLKYPFLIFMYVSVIAFLYSLFQIIKFWGHIDKGNAFSELSIKSLKHIKLSGIVMTILLYLAGMPAAYLVAKTDDAPGLIIIGFAFASIPLVVAAFAAVFQRLFQDAMDIKSKNDCIDK